MKHTPPQTDKQTLDRRRREGREDDGTIGNGGPGREKTIGRNEERTKNVPKLTPDNYIPLPELAKLANSKSNVLRKHRVAGWLAAGQAHKDPTGRWWIDPAVLPTVKPVQSRVAHSPVPPAAEETGRRGDKATGRNGDLFPDPPSSESARVDADGPATSLDAAMRTASPEVAMEASLSHVSPARAYELLKALEPPEEIRIAAALSNILWMRPIPWSNVVKLAEIGMAMNAADASNPKGER